MNAWKRFRCVFDYAGKQRRVTELEERSRAGNFWDDAQRAQGVMKQIADLNAEVDAIARVAGSLRESPAARWSELSAALKRGSLHTRTISTARMAT